MPEPFSILFFLTKNRAHSNELLLITQIITYLSTFKIPIFSPHYILNCDFVQSLPVALNDNTCFYVWILKEKLRYSTTE